MAGSGNDDHKARNKSFLLWTIPGIFYLIIFIQLASIIFTLSVYQIPFINFLSTHVDFNGFFHTIAIEVVQDPTIMVSFLMGKGSWIFHGVTFFENVESSNHHKKISITAVCLSILILLIFISGYLNTILPISTLPFNIPLNYAIISLFFILVAGFWLLTRLFSFYKSEKSSTSGMNIFSLFFIISFLFLIMFVAFYFNVIPDFEGVSLPKIAILVIPVIIVVLQYLSLRSYPFGYKVHDG